MTADLTDPQLLKLIQDGDKSAFTELVNRHTKLFYRIAFRFLNNRDSAEDMVQEAFLKLWDNTASWKPGQKAKFTTWFSRIIINQCLDYKKKSTNLRDTGEEVLPGDETTPYDAVDVKQSNDMINRLIDELPESQQTAINLCFYEGFSNREAAEIMGVNIKALESLLMRAKAGLRERINKMEGV